MASSEMCSRVVVDIVLLALLALLANIQGLLGFKGRVFGLNADPDAFDGRMYIVPVALTLVWASQSDGAVWAGKRCLDLVLSWEARYRLLLRGNVLWCGLGAEIGALREQWLGCTVGDLLLAACGGFLLRSCGASACIA